MLGGPAVRVQLLGRIEVAGPAGEAVLVGSRQRSLVGLLALVAGEVLPRDRLVDGLWGEDPPPTALRTLQSHVSRLRQVLDRCGVPGVLVTREPGYQLAVPRDRVDALRFEAASRAGRAMAAADPAGAVTVLRDALALWRGEAFADAEPYGWAAAEVRRLTEARLAAGEDLGEVLLRLGEHAPAADEVERLLVDHPLRERAVAVLMRALRQMGRPAEALRWYERLRERLAEDLGADPGPELQRLHAATLRGTPGPETPGTPAEPPPPAALTSPAELPPPVGYFTGRDTELSILDELVRGAPDIPIVAICGPAGIGKTALAVQWAYRVRHVFPDGQLFMDLVGHLPDAALRSDEVLAHALRALGIAPERVPAGVAGQLGLYRSLVRERRMLLVLDNAGTADHVLPLVPPGSGSLLLVTSRHRMAALPAHYAVQRIELDVLDRRDALTLLSRIVGAERVGRDPDGAAALVQACELIPLALRIAAARLAARPHLSIMELVGELSAHRLDALSVDGGSNSVRAVFASAYQVLSEPAMRLFRLLGQHPGGTFTAHLAAAAAGVSFGRARRGVDELAGVHLTAEVAAGRYRMHDLIRLYAHELSTVDEESGDVEAAVARILDWYLAIAYAGNRILDPGRDRVVPGVPVEVPFATDAGAALRFLDGERANLVAVAGYAERHGHHRVAWQLAYLVAGYFESRGHATDRITVCVHGLAAARRTGDPVPEGLMRSGLGVAHIAARRYREALEHLREALTLLTAVGDRRGEGHARNNIAAALMGLRRYDEAIVQFRQALAVHTASGHAHGTILALNNLGNAYGQAGQVAPSMRELRRGLALARRHGDVRLEAVVLSSMGETHRRAGADPQALACFEQALELRRLTDNRQYEARTLNEIGGTRLRLGAPAAAETAFTEAYEVAQRIGDEHLQAVALANLGRVALVTGAVDAARDHLTRALERRRHVPDEYEEAAAVQALGEVAQRTGDTVHAGQLWDRAIGLYRAANAVDEAAALAARRQHNRAPAAAVRVTP